MNRIDTRAVGRRTWLTLGLASLAAACSSSSGSAGGTGGAAAAGSTAAGLLATSSSGGSTGATGDTASSASSGGAAQGTSASSTASTSTGSSSGAGGGLPNGDLDAAKAFLAPLVVGFNVERGWAWDVPGGPKAEAQKLAALGVTHVRLFYPWSPSQNFGVNPGAPSSMMPAFLDAVQQWIDGGMTVFVDCTDLMGTDDFASYHDEIYQEVTDLANLAATYQFPKDKLAIGPINEWVGDDGNGGDPFAKERQDLHDILRTALPGYVLTASSEYWDSYPRLLQLTPLSDQRVIYSFHAYEDHGSPGEWQSAVADPLRQWSQAHGGLPILMGEADASFGTDSNPGAWPGWLDNALPAMATFRPTLWAITYGNAFRWNGSDGAVQDGSNGTTDLQTPLMAAIGNAKAALVGNDGSP